MDIKLRAWNKSGKRWCYFTLEEILHGAMYSRIAGTDQLKCHADNYEHWCLVEDNPELLKGASQ